MGNREELDLLGKKILTASRTELYLDMHFLGGALDALRYVCDLTTVSIGTDAVSIRFNPGWLFRTWLEQPRLVDRAYMHMLLHCIFRHMFFSAGDPALWNLSADIAVEHILDHMDEPCLRLPDSDLRSEWYGRLEGSAKVLTAERICRCLSDMHLDFDTTELLSDEFRRDDHGFWERLRDGKDGAGQPDAEQPPLPDMQGPHGGDKKEDGKKQDSGKDRKNSQAITAGQRKAEEEEWKNRAERLHTEMALLSKEASDATGSMDRVLRADLRKRTDYRAYLRHFAVLREEGRVDPDSFDYGLYNFGMEFYGNMPLFEENEFREARRIDQLAIALDTSGSCQDALVQKFLNETASILASQESFFHRVEIHIIECDDQVQADTVIRDPAEMKKYTDAFHVKGGFGTDFRPVFSYIAKLRQQGILRRLCGLLYFTDGFGKYPSKPPGYETAFVFRSDEEMDDSGVPDWAAKLYV
ncbi:MAG: VWA-like domain-containing protein [Lachnospiraceae bacterium]|jgi:predicted metal-dependent peptidase|nr:VWA-like domain-containing protein [Lachnospiraceae bacterium]